jgi:DNA-binding response OmpR family regulator
MPPLGIIVDLKTNSVAVGWHPTEVKLSPMETELLSVLATAAPAAVSYEVITAKLWGAYGEICEMSNLKVLTYHLRRKIKVLGLSVVAIWEYGYRLVKTEPGGTG